MGGGKGLKTFRDSETTSQQTVGATAEETELNKLLLERSRETQAGQIDLQKAGLDVTGRLLRGEALPGKMQGLWEGISPQITQEIAQESVRDLMPSFQQTGVLDSGAAASIAARTAGDVRRQSAQFNLQNISNLLSQGLGGQAAVQQPIAAQQQQLGGALAGLRSTTGNQRTTQVSNPFLEAFFQRAGSSLASTATGGRSFGSKNFGVGAA